MKYRTTSLLALTSSAFLALSTLGALAEVCKDGKAISWFTEQERTAAQEECRKNHGGLYATCSNRSQSCQLAPGATKKNIQTPYRLSN